MQHKYTFFTILLLLFNTLSLNAYAHAHKDFATQRKLFLQVEADLKAGKVQSFQQHKHTLSEYPLYPYIKYELLKSVLTKLKYHELKEFIDMYQDSPVSDKLRVEWLKNKAQHSQWHDFLLAYDENLDQDEEMVCHYVNANLKTNGDSKAYDLLPSIWLSAKSLPKACDGALAAWQSSGRLTRNLLWQRIKLAITKDNTQLARYLAKLLPEHEQKIVELWIRTHNDPHLVKKEHYFSTKHSAISEMIIHAIGKIARRDPELAVKLWGSWEKKHKFNEHHWGLVVKEIALALSRKFDQRALKWFDSLPDSQLGKDVYDARLKLAIYHNSWESIAKLYTQLPPDEANSDKWQYWYVRALEMMGDREHSQTLLGQLSQKRNYYGFLASSRLLRPYAFNNEVTAANNKVSEAILLNPAIVRAYELKQIGRVHAGRSEWRKALSIMDDSELIAAAQLANEWDVPNWAIVALSNAKQKNDLLLRFPQNFAEYIHREAKRNQVDPELLFAITRQESAFIPTAKSPAGALGLMQIMPQTGKMIAHLSKEPLRHQSELLVPEKNIKFGSKYVRMMLDQNQHNTTLAAASYNAGPHRVLRWLPEYDMPADSWIETIPFKETREYVQNVLTYTVIYQQLLGKTPKLSKHMQIINGTKRKHKRAEG